MLAKNASSRWPHRPLGGVDKGLVRVIRNDKFGGNVKVLRGKVPAQLMLVAAIALGEFSIPLRRRGNLAAIKAQAAKFTSDLRPTPTDLSVMLRFGRFLAALNDLKFSRDAIAVLRKHLPLIITVTEAVRQFSVQLTTIPLGIGDRDTHN